MQVSTQCARIVNMYSTTHKILLLRQPVAATHYQCQHSDTSFCPVLPIATESLPQKHRGPESKWGRLGNLRAGTTDKDISN